MVTSFLTLRAADVRLFVFFYLSHRRGKNNENPDLVFEKYIAKTADKVIQAMLGGSGQIQRYAGKQKIRPSKPNSVGLLRCKDIQ